MQVENIKRLLQEIEDLFVNLDTNKKMLEKQIMKKEDEQKDYLHELELARLNGIEIMKVANALIKTRKERRSLKNELELLNTVKGYADKYITKGIIADTKQAITNIERLEKNQETRKYVPRIIQNLKCVKENKNDI